MTNISKLSFIILLVFLFAACKQSKEGKKVSKGKIDSVVHRLTALEDSIQNSWKSMSQNEEEMFFSIKRLLQEIEYVPGHDPVPLDTLRKANEETKNMRYNQETMRESTLIDRYDESLSTLINNVTRYANSVKGLEKHQVASQLLEEIPQQYQKIYLNRVHYDFHIQDYNQLLKSNKKRLEKYKPEYEKLNPKPMFKLSEG